MTIKKRLRWNRNIIYFALALIVVIIPIVAIQIYRATRAKAAWYDDAWTYRQKITVSNTGTSLTNFQVNLNLDTAALITATKMQSSCNDIRITDEANRLMPHWVEGCNTTTTKIWTKIPSLPVENQTYYLYYGNSSAPNLEKPDSVFDFFDNFDGATVDTSKWTVNATNYAVSGGSVRLNVGAMRTTNALPFNLNDGYILDSRMYTHATANIYGGTLTATDNAAFVQGNNTGSNAMILLMRTPNSTGMSRWIGSGSAASYNIANATATYTFSNTTWYVFSESFYSGGLSLSQNYGAATNVSLTWAKNPKFITLGYFSGNTDLQDTSYDWVRVRKYAATAPTVNFASEEKTAGPTLYWKMDTTTPAVINDIEQQINIIDQEYSSTSTSFVPLDNSLGIVHWDASKYPGATVYLEVVFKKSSAAENSYVGLYETDGTQNYNMSTCAGLTTWCRQRSAALTLTDNTDYTIRVQVGQIGRTLWLKSARLIIIQTNSAKITDTETQVEVGNSESQLSNTATQLTNPKIYYHDSSKFTPTPSTYFEATLQGIPPPTIEQQINIIDQQYSSTSTSFAPTDNSLGIFHWDAAKYPGATVYLEVVFQKSSSAENGWVGLYKTDGTQAYNMSTCVGLTTWCRQRSAALTLTDNTDYTVRVQASSGRTVWLRSARLIIIQTNSTKITDTQTQIEVGNNETTVAASYTSLTHPKIYYYDSSKFTPAPTVYFEASLSNDTAGQTTYAALYTDGAACSSQVSGSEVTVTGTAWTRTRSSALTFSSGTEYTVCIKAGANTARIADAKIILDQTDAGGITAVEVIHQQVNAPNTDTDSTYSSQTFINRFNPGLESTQLSFSSGSLNYFFESTLKTTAGTGYSRLYDNTMGAVTSAEVTTTNTTYTRVRSADITSSIPSFPTYNTAHDMETQLKNSAASGNTTTASSSWLIIQVSNLSTTGAPIAYTDLYNSTDSQSVSGSEVSTSTPGWARLRSAALTLPSEKEYLVRTWTSTSNNGSRANIANAKIILDQSDAEGISAFETVQDQADFIATDTDSTYTSQTFLNYFDPTSFRFSDKVAYFEATAKTTAGTGYAQLYNSTDSLAITNSPITTTSTTYTRVRSPDITANLPTTAKALDIQLKNSAASGNTTSVASSRLILQVTGKPQTPDSSQNRIYGLLSNTSQGNPSDCVVDACADFNGTNSSIIRGYLSILNPGTASFTVSAWFRHPTTPSANEYLLTRYNAAGWKIWMNTSGQVCVGLDDDSTWGPDDSLCSANGYNNTSWHQVAVVKNGTSSLNLYIDGHPINTLGTLTATGTLSGTTPTLYAGVDSTGTSGFFNGRLDEVKYYSFAKTATDIIGNYAAKSIPETGNITVLGLPGSNPLPDPAVYWNFDENNGALAHNNGTAGTANNATITNGTWTSSGKVNNALTFDATTSVTATIADPGSTYSISLWLKPTTSIANKTILASSKLTTDGSSRPVFGTCTGNAIPLDQWTHLLVASNGAGSCAIYQNGVQIATNTTGVSFGTTITLGASSYTGLIDEFKLYTTALSAGNTPIDMNAGSASTISIDDHTDQGFAGNPPVGEWKMDENQAQTVNDSSGNNYSGTLGSTSSVAADDPVWSSGKIGSALRFDGTDDYVNIPYNISLAPANFSISAWVMRTDTCASSRSIYKSAAGNGYTNGWLLGCGLWGNNAASFRWGGGGGSEDGHITDSVAMPLNTWQYLEATFDGTTMRLYVDGTLVDSDNTVTLLYSDTANAAIGYSNGVPYWPGLIDNVRLYNYTRTPAQIAWDYNKGAPVAWYKLDECQGSVAHNVAVNGNGQSTGMNGTITPNAGRTVGTCNSGVSTEIWNGGTVGKYNASLALDGTGDYVDIGTGPTSINTISFWVKPTTTTEYPLDVNGTEYIWINGGTVTATGFSSPTIYVGGIATTAITSGVWQHVTIVTSTPVNATDLDLGRIEGVGYFEGQLDDVQLYNYTLTPTQIKTLYNNRSAVQF